TDSETLAIANATTNTISLRCGASSPIRRRADERKFFAFCGGPILPLPPLGGPPGGGLPPAGGGGGRGGGLPPPPRPPVWSCRPLLLLGLRCHDLGIRRARRDELVVGALTDELAAVEHQDLVGVADARDSLRDDDQRGLREPRCERSAQARLSGEVECRER